MVIKSPSPGWRLLAGVGGSNRARLALTYVLVIPGTFPFVVLTRKLVSLRADQMAVGIAVATATALGIDGIIVAWFPAVYGGHLPQVTYCAAVILWGAGVALILGFFMNKGAET